MNVPSVSVVMPVYNGGDFLVEAVRSILEQTHTDLELLVLDDGSTDNAVSLLEGSNVDSRVRILRHENIGLAATLNRGIAESRGEFICRMDADDVSHKDRLAVQFGIIARHSEVVLVGSQIKRIAGQVVGSSSNFPLEHEEIVRGLLLREHVVCHPSTMMRKEAMVACGGYWNHGVAEDWDLFLKLSERGLLANVDIPLLHYRFHDGGINVDSMSAVRWNMRLAISNYRRRQLNQDELEPGIFISEASRIERLLVKMEVRSLKYYRRHLHFLSRGNSIRASALLACAAAFWPAQAFRRLAVGMRRVSNGEQFTPDRAA